MSLYHYKDGNLVQMTSAEESRVSADWPKRAVDNKLVPLTQEEIDQRKREEAEWQAAAPMRELLSIESQCGMSRKERDLAMLLPDGHFLRDKAAKAESAIEALGVRGKRS